MEFNISDQVSSSSLTVSLEGEDAQTIRFDSKPNASVGNYSLKFKQCQVELSLQHFQSQEVFSDRQKDKIEELESFIGDAKALLDKIEKN